MPQARRIVPDGAIRAGLNTDSGTIPANRIVRDHTLTDSVRLCTDANQRPKGVSMEAIAVGVTGDIQIAGKVPVEAGAAVNKGDAIGSDTVGRGIATTDEDDFPIGVAATAASGAGVLFEVELKPFMPIPPAT